MNEMTSKQKLRNSLQMQLQLVENSIKLFKGKIEMKLYDDNYNHYKTQQSQESFRRRSEESNDFKNLIYRKSILEMDLLNLNTELS